jgi:hypothetical protein
VYFAMRFPTGSTGESPWRVWAEPKKRAPFTLSFFTLSPFPFHPSTRSLNVYATSLAELMMVPARPKVTDSSAFIQ